MPDRTVPAEGVILTVPDGHPLLRDVTIGAEQVTDTVAALAGELASDPVDLLAVHRLATRLAAQAEELDCDADCVIAEVWR